MLYDAGEKAARFAHPHIVVGAPRRQKQRTRQLRGASQSAQLPQSRTQSRQPCPALPGGAGNATGCPKNGQTHTAGKHQQRLWMASWITFCWRGQLVPKAKNCRIWATRLQGCAITKDGKGTAGLYLIINQQSHPAEDLRRPFPC